MPPDDSSQDDPMTSAAVAAMFTEAQTGSEFCILRRDYYTKLTNLKTRSVRQILNSLRRTGLQTLL